jgi:hypothetical protein
VPGAKGKSGELPLQPLKRKPMTILTKALLAVSVAGMVAGSFLDFIGATLNPMWTACARGGVALWRHGYGFFLISLALGKETAKFDPDKARGPGLSRVTPAVPALTSLPPLILSPPWDEFNKVPVAEMSNLARLSQMLDDAAIAFLVTTPGGEQKNGTVRTLSQRPP